MHRHWRLMALGVVLMVIEGGMLGLLAWMMGPMFDEVFVAHRAGAIWTVGFAILGIFVTRAVTSVGQRVVMTRLSEKAAAEIRVDLLGHLMALDANFHRQHPPGTLIERVQGDVGATTAIWNTVTTGVARDAVSVVALMSVAVSIDWRWTAIALIGVPVLIAPSQAVHRHVRTAATAARRVAATMAMRLDEVFHGLVQIRLNRLESYQSERFRRLTREKVHTETRAAAAQAMIPGLIDIMSGIGFLGVLWWGGTQVIAGERTVGDFMAFFTAIGVAFDPVRRLGGLSGQWQQAAASVTRVRDLLDTRSELREPAHPVPPPVGAPEIRFDGVRLAYDGKTVLDGLSFTARAGQTTAIVGASGAGKSTVFNLLTRLVDADSGRITLGGVGVGDMRLADLRGLFSVVTQDAALFDETLLENILLGRTDVAEARLQAVLEDAQVASFLPQLARGVETPVGARGSALSGGQRQRVAIARALLRDAPVLLLDEATSALDTRSEALVQAALDRLAAGRTTLVIAHRLSTVIGANHIIVMDAGRLVEEGRHADLIARGGVYAALHAMQFRDPAPASGDRPPLPPE
ncbi:MAG: ABC transporter ATP-binding protein [Rubellimicrobium sp.]|nr:ABC transporter ATP-binding protein [Rubellimicrobium sp.]